MLVSWSNPAPGADTSLTTSMSTPLRASFRRPRSSESSGLGGEPDQHLPRAAPGCQLGQDVRRWARGRSRAHRPPWTTSARRRPSGGSRRPLLPSPPRRPSAHASSMASLHLGRRLDPDDLDPRRRPPARTCVTRVTMAPRRAAASATAWPCLPDERLVRNRTGSRGSRVPPGAHHHAPALEVPRRFDRGSRRSRRTRSTMVRRLGQPSRAPSRRRPDGLPREGPRSRRAGASVARFSWTAGCSHISVCMAGHTTTGDRVASRVAVNRSSASPAA